MSCATLISGIQNRTKTFRPWNTNHTVVSGALQAAAPIADTAVVHAQAVGVDANARLVEYAPF